MIIVHHLNNSRSQRVLWLLEELGLEYEVKRYERNPETLLAPATLREVHPLGKSPVITDGALTLAESGAIIEYVIRRHGSGRLQPDPASPAYDEYVCWLHYAEGSAMLPLLLQMYVGRLGPAGAPLEPRIETELANHLGFLATSLRGRSYLLGEELTGADIQMSFVGEKALADAYGGREPHPEIEAWVRRLQARPAYRAALERGGQPYRFLR